MWDVADWGDYVAAILDIYQPSAEPGAKPVAERFRDDWQLFTFDDIAKINEFLLASTKDVARFQILETQEPVSPRYAEDGVAANHKARWDEFRNELMTKNRYFPDVAFDFDYLKELVTANVRRLAPGLRLFRARSVSVGKRLGRGDMGVPPPNLVSGGRANPVGIPHLYLSNNISTCMQECRAQFNGDVAVATFELVREISYLDLADLRPANPFLLDDRDPASEANPLIKSLVANQFLAELGRELSVPIRPAENQIEYVPTQYLCEFVKSQGVGGIRYQSSLNPEGWNVVIFDDASTTQVADIQHFHVTAMSLSFDPV